jgi:D-alanyl-D-alanine carboxypeptidase
MRARLAPLGVRLLTAHLDLRDMLAAPLSHAVQRGARRLRDPRAPRRFAPIAVHRRADDMPLGRIVIERNPIGPLAFHLSPPGFAASAAAGEALAALTHALPSRRRPRLMLETGLIDQALPLRAQSAPVQRLAHYAPFEDREAHRLAALGVASDYGATRGLERIVEPGRLALVGPDYARRPLWLVPAAKRAVSALLGAARDAGVDIKLVSGFRSVGYQFALIRRKLVAGQHIDEVLKVLAAPGYSEHHSGTALDFTTEDLPGADSSFESTDAYRWLMQHAAGFGFRLSYPRDNPHGIAFEPWHWRYVGA